MAWVILHPPQGTHEGLETLDLTGYAFARIGQLPTQILPGQADLFAEMAEWQTRQLEGLVSIPDLLVQIQFAAHFDRRDSSAGRARD